MRSNTRASTGAGLAPVGRRATPPRLLSERVMQALVQETEEIDFHGWLAQAVILKQGEFIRQVATTAAQANLHVDHCVATGGLPEEQAAELRHLLVEYLDHARRLLEVEQDRSLLLPPDGGDPGAARGPLGVAGVPGRVAPDRDPGHARPAGTAVRGRAGPPLLGERVMTKPTSSSNGKGATATAPRPRSCRRCRPPARRPPRPAPRLSRRHRSGSRSTPARRSRRRCASRRPASRASPPWPSSAPFATPARPRPSRS